MRSDAREAAFKIVYAQLFHDDCDETFKGTIYKKANLTDEETSFAKRLVSLVEEHRAELLERIAEAVMPQYSEYRIYPVDKAIMLVALAEIFFCDDVPNVVAVSEATTLARKYSTENSANFVNGVLGGIINK